MPILGRYLLGWMIIFFNSPPVVESTVDCWFTKAANMYFAIGKDVICVRSVFDQVHTVTRLADDDVWFIPLGQ